MHKCIFVFLASVRNIFFITSWTSMLLTRKLNLFMTWQTYYIIKLKKQTQTVKKHTFFNQIDACNYFKLQIHLTSLILIIQKANRQGRRKTFCQAFCCWSKSNYKAMQELSSKNDKLCKTNELYVLRKSENKNLVLVSTFCEIICNAYKNKCFFFQKLFFFWYNLDILGHFGRARRKEEEGTGFCCWKEKGRWAKTETTRGAGNKFLVSFFSTFFNKLCFICFSEYFFAQKIFVMDLCHMVNARTTALLKFVQFQIKKTRIGY